MEARKKQRILVIGEMQKEKLSPVTYELMYAADCLKKEMDAAVSVVLMGNGMAAEAEKLCHYPVMEILYLESAPFWWGDADICVRRLLPVLKAKEPAVILIGATAFGRILGAALAWQLGTEIITDALSMWYDRAADRMVVTRPAFDGKMMADYTVVKKPLVVTIRQGIMKKAVYSENRQGRFVQDVSDEVYAHSGIQWMQDMANRRRHKNLAEAAVIVSGGRGLKGGEGFRLLEKLAERLGAEVGSTRPCVDAGWTVPSQQVGQSGIAVKPKLYIAFGISGAIQHMTGIEAEHMIAVNSDSKAAIFQYCDYGIVGDAREILRTMIEKIDAGEEIFH